MPPPDYDTVLKDGFQREAPSFVNRYGGGAKLRRFLNLELPQTLRRAADLLAEFDDGSLLHLELQSQNHQDMVYRVGMYGILIHQKYRRPLHQVVLYVGRGPMRMRARLKIAGIEISFELIDIRELNADDLIATGNRTDLALAMLAGGGGQRLRRILTQAGRLDPAARDRVLTQLTVLSGLRGLSEPLKMEMDIMGLQIDIEKNAILRDLVAKGREKWREEGRAEGLEQGREEMLRTSVASLLAAKFGKVPRWAQQRLTQAESSQLNRWMTEILLQADTLEGVLGPR